MRVLVTGATGLLGRGVAGALAARGDDVVSLVRPGRATPDGTTALVHDLFEQFPPTALPEVDCVVHLSHHADVAFPANATALHRLNTSATQELLEAARRRGVERFVYASSGTVYGFGNRAVEETDTPRADDFYALTKRHAEELVLTYGAFLETCLVRPFFPYGRGQSDRLVPRLAARIAAGEPVAVRRNGAPRINPIYVDDAVEAIVAAADGRAPAILNLAGPDVVAIPELAAAVGAIVGRAPRYEELSDDVDGDLVGATGRLEAVLRRPLVPLEEGLRRTLSAATG